MAIKDIFDASVAQDVIKRIQTLQPDTQRLWGTMSVDQMLAHCNVTYELVFEPQKHKKPNFFMKWLMKTFIKPKTTSEVAYKPNLPTASFFVIKGLKDFDLEKKRLIGFVQKCQQLGRVAFDGKESSNFGQLTAQEWNNLFFKHLDHHLRQFGV